MTLLWPLPLDLGVLVLSKISIFIIAATESDLALKSYRSKPQAKLYTFTAAYLVVESLYSKSVGHIPGPFI